MLLLQQPQAGTGRDGCSFVLDDGGGGWRTKFFAFLAPIRTVIPSEQHTTSNLFYGVLDG